MQTLSDVTRGELDIRPTAELTANVATKILSHSGIYLIFFSGSDGTRDACYFVHIHGTWTAASKVNKLFETTAGMYTFDTSVLGELTVTSTVAARVRIITIQEDVNY